MRDLLITLIIFASIPYILMRPHLGVLVWSWLGYMNPHRLAYGFAYTMPFTLIVAATTILSMIFSKEKKTFPWSKIAFIWIAFVCWTFISYFFAINPIEADIEFSRMVKIQIMIICTMLLINNRDKLVQLIWVIVVSIGFYGVKGGLFAIRTGFNYRISGPKDTFFGANNEMALALLMIIPLMYFLFTISKHKYVRWGLAGAILLSFFAVVSSYSRGAFLGMAVMLFFLWLGTKRKIISFSLVFAIILAGIPFLPQKWFDRMNTIETYQQDASAMGRINAWHFAVNLANDRPLIGGGFRAFSPEAFLKYAPIPDDYHDAHSIYFEILGEQGYVGLLLFLSIWVMVFLEARKIKKLTRENQDLKWMADLMTMIQISLIAYMTSGAFLGLAYFDLPYHLMSVVAISGFLCRKYIAEEIEHVNKNNLSYAR